MDFVALCLGNPGSRFEKTRHNAGFFVAGEISRRIARPLKRRLLRPYRWMKYDHMVLVQPLTFMNRSGEVLPLIDRKEGSLPAHILVVFDQMDLPGGSVRLKQGGGAGGHRGVQSVIDYLGDRHLYKLAVGIGRPKGDMSVTDWVLSSPRPESDEERLLRSGVEKAADVVLRLRCEEVTTVMNDVNRR